MDLFNIILILTITLLLFWYRLQDKYCYWSSRGFPSVNLFKCCFQFLHHTFGGKPFFEIFNDHHAELAGHGFGGAFIFTQPALILRDPELIKEIVVKNFSNFHDRHPTRDEKTDQLSGNLLQLTGDKWRLLRNTMSPAFSSAKMKIMYDTAKECSRELDAHLQKLCSKTGGTELDVKELMKNYTMEVIGACTLGIKCNAIEDPNCEFKRVAQRIFKLDLRRTAHLLVELIHPKLPRLFRMKAVDPEIEKFLLSVCKETIELKKRDTTLTQKDFLSMLMTPRSYKKEEVSKAEKQVGEVESSVDVEGFTFTAHVMAGTVGSFLAGGFEPVSSALAFLFYHLALNPEVQEKVWGEIQTVEKDVEVDISYEDLNKFQYADQVIKEILRLYPVAGVFSRCCTEPFKIPNTSLVIEKNVRVFIPHYGIHRDPKYFPEPNKFDPDRFSEKNIDNIVQGSYIPFGLGPRSCIAKRLALVAIKTMLIKMVSKYTFHTCSKTQQRIKFDPVILTLCPKGGVWLRIQMRK